MHSPGSTGGLPVTLSNLKKSTFKLVDPILLSLSHMHLILRTVISYLCKEAMEDACTTHATKSLEHWSLLLKLLLGSRAPGSRLLQIKKVPRHWPMQYLQVQ